MQVSEVKTSSSASNLVQAKRQPFFNKEGQDSFFFKSNETTTSFFSPTTIQPKLTIGQPNDKYEVEADAMADKVVQKLSESDSSSTSESQIPEIQAKCNTCDKEEEVQKKEEEEVHAKEDESPAIEEQVPELQQKPIFESNTDEAIQAKIEPTVAEPIMTPVKISPAVPTPITQPAVQAKCDDCEKEAVEEGEEVQELQRKEAHDQRAGKAEERGAEGRAHAAQRRHEADFQVLEGGGDATAGRKAVDHVADGGNGTDQAPEGSEQAQEYQQAGHVAPQVVGVGSDIPKATGCTALARVGAPGSLFLIRIFDFGLFSLR